MLSPVTLVLERLEPWRVRESGHDRWRACCPAHGGRNASALSIGVGGEGQVLLTCFAGCPIEDVVHALGLEMNDLFPPRESHGKPARPRRMLSAGQALDLLAREATLVAVAAANLAVGISLTDVDRDRLRKAAARIGYLHVEVCA